METKKRIRRRGVAAAATALRKEAGRHREGIRASTETKTTVFSRQRAETADASGVRRRMRRD
jgi:hypothetical protein